MDGASPQLRTDWLLGRSVIVAENRALRPNEFGSELFDVAGAGSALDQGRMAAAGLMPHSGALKESACPFCRGQEHRTPPATFELTDEHHQWRTRVVPNMFPAVVPEEFNAGLVTQFSLDATKPPVNTTTFVTSTGVHEVIIETPAHINCMSSLSIHEVRDVLVTYAGRLRQVRGTVGLRYGLIFKNQGARAGASLAHLHSQLIALPETPPAVAAEFARAASAAQDFGTCAYCRMADTERKSAERCVVDRDGFIAFCPFASIQPFETWLLPVEHAASFEDLQPDNLVRLANILVDVLRRVEAVAPEAAYNMLLRTAPWQPAGQTWCHWRIEILPRASALAGFELASGVFINPLAPERAASKLRSI
jgi:UDPglucose--hexose-1-phosphate uridylyltransferase